MEILFTCGYMGPGGPEFLVVLLVLLMMFGAKDAPRILRKLNDLLNQVRNTADGFKREIMYSDLDLPGSDDAETLFDGVHEEHDDDGEVEHDEEYEYLDDDVMPDDEAPVEADEPEKGATEQEVKRAE